MAKERIDLDYADDAATAGAMMRTPGGDALPQALDPVVTMDLVQRYVETERARTRRALIWTGMVFLFVLLAVLAMFVSIGIFVLRHSRKTSAVVARVQDQTAAYATEVLGMTHKLDSLEAEQGEVSGALRTVHAERARSKAVLESDLSRFSRWVASSRDRESRARAAMDARLLEMEKQLALRERNMEDLRKRYETLLGQGGVARRTVRADAPAPMRRPDADLDGGTVPMTASAMGLADLVESYPGRGAGAAEPADRAPSGRAPRAEAGGAADAAGGEGRETLAITFPNGDRYEGEFRNGLLDGYGVYTYSNGDRYEGRFQNDRRHGEGTMLYSNGNKYIGDFHENERHGKGRFVFANGDVYEGDFVNGVRSGRGTYIFSDGARYIGEFKDGKMHGQGRYIYTGGEEYIGEFADGKKHGEGICVYQNGREIKVLWENDRFIRTLKN